MLKVKRLLNPRCRYAINIAISLVPTPGSMALLGGAGLLVGRRRR